MHGRDMLFLKSLRYGCSWCGDALEPDQLQTGLCSDECAEKTYYGDYGPVGEENNDAE